MSLNCFDYDPSKAGPYDIGASTEIGVTYSADQWVWMPSGVSGEGRGRPNLHNCAATAAGDNESHFTS